MKLYLFENINRTCPMFFIPQLQEGLGLILSFICCCHFQITPNFISSIFTFSLPYCTFIFVSQLPLSIIHFCKMSCRFITGRQGGNTTTVPVLSSVHELNNRLVVTNHQQTLKEVTWSGCTSVAYIVICGLKSKQHNLHFMQELTFIILLLLKFELCYWGTGGN